MSTVNALQAVVLIVVFSLTPSVLFLGFWRGLMALRDDELINQLHHLLAGEPTPARTTEEGPIPPTDLQDFDTLVADYRNRRQYVVQCDGCKTLNAVAADRCQVCGATLS